MVYISPEAMLVPRVSRRIGLFRPWEQPRRAGSQAGIRLRFSFGDAQLGYSMVLGYSRLGRARC